MLTITVVLPRPFAPVRARDGDQFGVIGQSLEVQREGVEALAVADAAKTLEGQREGLHGDAPMNCSDQSLA